MGGSHHPSPLGPPCPKCGQLGRRNQFGRQDKKYRCVNTECDVLFFSWQDAIDGERARQLNAAPPEQDSKKEVIQENLFGDKRTD